MNELIQAIIASGWQHAVTAGIFAAAAIFLLYSLHAAKQKLLVDNLPVSKTTGVFIGEVELVGAAYAQAPLASFLAQQPCVYWRYRIEEQWEKTETATETDSSGKTRTVQRTENGWQTIAQGSSDDTPFWLKDDHGTIRIQPKGANVEPRKVLDRQCTRSDSFYYRKAPQEAIANSTHHRRFTEEIIAPGAALFVVGHARQRDDAVAAELAAHPKALYVISTWSKKDVSFAYRLKFWIAPLAGFALLAAALAWWLHRVSAHYPPPSTYAWAAGGYLGAWLLGWIWVAFNSLVELRQRVAQGWANIDVELKRRADLIPSLVKLVSAMRDYESRVQAHLAALRAQVGATAPGTAGPNPVAVARPLQAIAEAYPELKSHPLFLKLQQQIAQTEDRIALARAYFNDIATFYNTRLAVFPDGVVARLGGMRPRTLLEAAGFERSRPSL